MKKDVNACLICGAPLVYLPEAKPMETLDTGMMVISPTTMGSPITLFTSTISRILEMVSCSILGRFWLIYSTAFSFLLDFQKFYQGPNAVDQRQQQ